MADLPLIDTAGMTRSQRAGRGCVSCQKAFPRPTVPVGQLVTGEVIFRCRECLVTLEQVEPGAGRVLTTPCESEQPR